ncbi:MAG: valyl-tRNA synthetase [Gammaproteobacteria bacterium]|jgi:valyl-tRNA synthetase|nr:valyl-tRNA synthetase [Gammaproteobacteria bacterium]
MEKTYLPHQIEKTWYQKWENKGYFQHGQAGISYCIVIPPPNVTGTLHMGHGFQDTLMDVLIRYHRMQGDNTLWQMGTDHAGIATQMVVERQLQQENKTRHDLGREAFVERVWEWKAQSGNQICQQIRRMGCSVDWSRERFTLDDDLSHAVKKVFIDLYREGLIYRGKRLVNWDPSLCTAVSDLEVVSSEETGHLWHIDYPLSQGNGYLTVATTRPETLLGDAAVAVHPDDERYQHFIGKMLRLPLTDREIPVIADEYVDPAFGSGCVKITPAHDFNDYAVGLRHQLPMINIFTPTAHINENMPASYQGLSREKAREKVIIDLTQQGLLAKTLDHTLTVPRCEKTGVIVEPYLTDQWFLKTAPLAKPAMEAVKRGDIRLVPNTWEKTYFQWLENIQDWCISRQLWWGHRIPAWYDEAGNIYAGEDENDVRLHYKLSSTIKLTQDNDVLDTWFSSALWPFSTLGWPNKTPELETFYPTSVLVTGFDIIFFWVARMIMMGLKFTQQVPFKTVYITGLIRDHDGQKMSKSKGNVLDPIDLIDGISLDDLLKKRTQNLMQPGMAKRIEKITRSQFPEGIASYGTDALRFTYCALASTGRDIRFDIGRLDGYRNFCNKIWNAARYVLMNVENTEIHKPHSEDLTVSDKWILSILNQTIAQVHQHVQEYRFDLLANTLYDFVWNEYCDWYLELVKPVLMGDSPEKIKNAARYTLVFVLETILRLLHPLMPFITEEIWQRVKPLTDQKSDTIMLAPYPKAQAALENEEAVADLQWLKQIVTTIRTIRSEMNVSPAKKITILLRKGSKMDEVRAQSLAVLLCHLAKVENWRFLKTDEAVPPSATGLMESLEILIPLQGLIDKAAELGRLRKTLAKVEQDLSKSQSKLANPNYVDKAPLDVVEKEKQLVLDLSATLEKLKAQIVMMENI